MGVAGSLMVSKVWGQDEIPQDVFGEEGRDPRTEPPRSRASSLGDEKGRGRRLRNPAVGCLNSLINKCFQEGGSDQLCQMLLRGRENAVADGRTVTEGVHLRGNNSGRFVDGRPNQEGGSDEGEAPCSDLLVGGRGRTQSTDVGLLLETAGAFTLNSRWEGRGHGYR